MEPKLEETVDTKNIQGSIWPRLPRYYETFLFFKIKDVDTFKPQLRELMEANKITTGDECKNFLNLEAEAKKKNAGTKEGKTFNPISEAREKEDTLPEDRITFNAINLAFTGKGVSEMIGDYTDRKLRDLLHQKGMYQDLVNEGSDAPERLSAEYKPPPGYPANNGDWRNDGMFIVAAQRKEELDQTINELNAYFDIGKEDASIEFTVTKEGQVRNADGKAERRQIPDESDPTGTKTRIENLHGKEHFGFEDQISQPQIRGLDEKPGPKEPEDIPPGWIFLGHDGDNTRSPEWAKDGSYLVFREIEENVPEFNNFVKKESEKLDGFKDGTGEKLAAHMIGRWKNGSPVDLDTETSVAKHPYANNFEYRRNYSSGKDVKCPFGAHIRKMRPRADLYVGKEGDDNVTVESNTVNNSNVILRRSITFGPEMKDEETKPEGKKERRGIYFLCYQSDLRNGFNLLVTRWASNTVFASKKNFNTNPGVDPIVSQRNRPDHKEGYFSIFEKNENPEPKSIRLGYLPWIDQKGGEYFFTPSIKALKTIFVDDIP